MNAIPLSAVMICHQSERRLEAVLSSLRFCNDIVVVDSGSTDRTRAIADRFGARWFHRPFDDFSQQKQFAVDQAKNDWVLVIDSDEVVNDPLQAAIVRLFGNSIKEGTTPQPAFRLPRLLYFLGKKISHSGGIDDPVRLFHRKFARFDGARVHEQIRADGPVLDIPTNLVLKPNSEFLEQPFLEHYSYDTLGDYFKKYHRYTTEAALELRAQGRHIQPHKILLSFPVTFIKFYFLKLGFLDGWAGFLWCFFSATAPVVKYIKAMFNFRLI